MVIHFQLTIQKLFMRSFLFISAAITISMSFVQTEIFEKKNPVNTTNILTDTIKKKNVNSKNEQWNVFWKSFTTAIYAKDKNRIAELTSKDFYDGGGGTVQQWLDAEVFINDKKFTAFKNILKTGTRNFKGYDGHPYKATGKNRSGDLFFEYKNDQWLFGGIVGD